MLRVGASSTAVMVSLRHDRSGAAPVVDRGGSFTTIGRFDGPERGWRADVAQSVERLTCNQQVAGSTPAIGSASRQQHGRGEVPERPKGADCKSAGERLRRFESSPLHSERVTNDETMRRGSSSVGRARAFQARGRGFDSRLPLQKSRPRPKARVFSRCGDASHCAQGRSGITIFRGWRGSQVLLEA